MAIARAARLSLNDAMATSSMLWVRLVATTTLLASVFSSPAKAADSAKRSSSVEQSRYLRGNPAPSSSGVSADARSFFANVPQLIQKWRSLPSSERGKSRVLADIRVDQLRDDYQTVQHVQQVIAIGDTFDISPYRVKSIEFAPQTQKLTILRARLHHSDGSTTKAQDLGPSSAEDPSSYEDVEKVRFRGLRVADVIELEYTISPLLAENPYGKYFADIVAFGGPLNSDLQRYVICAPRAIHVSSAEHLLEPAKVRKSGDEDIYVWEKRNIGALVREQRSPSWSEQGAYVHVSNFGTWQELATWYAELIRPQFELNDDLRKVAAEMIAEHPNRLERVEAIDDLVLKKTRYVALELGVYRFKPYPVSQTFARGFGDCKDKASLMVALMRATGIDAQIALLRTQELGEIIPEPASASTFDHAVVYVPEFDLWLDGTAEFARPRELPVEDQGVMALTVDLDGHATLRRTPMSSAEDNYSRRVIHAHLDSNGTLHFSGDTYVRGEDAPELRRELEPGGSKVGYVHDHLAQVLPAVEVRHVELPDADAEAVSLDFDGELTSFRGKHTAMLPSSWMRRNYVDTLAPDDERTQELRLDAPWTTEEEIHIELPPGAHVANLPSDLDRQAGFARALISYRVEGDQVVVFSRVQFSRTQIPVSEYAAFRNFVMSLEKSFSQTVKVSLQ